MAGGSVIYSGNEDIKAYKSSIAGWALLSLLTMGIGLIVALPAVAVLYLKARSSSYLIDRDKLQMEYGILSRTIQTMELWRVTDLQFRQSFTQRLFGECTVAIVSQDKTNPVLLLRGFPAPTGKEIFTQLQSAVSHARKDKNVVGLVS